MTQPRRSLVALVLSAVLLGGTFAHCSDVQAAEETCFDATGFCVGGAFRDYWENNGGLALNGYPLTDQRIETLEDGKTYTVQYFERVRMEYHPENDAPNQVLLGQFGRRIHGGADPAVAPSGAGTYYPETGHNIGGAFLAYWRGNGGLAQFGYPLTEAFSERLEDGKTYTVQYFERARFELHPEHPDPYRVLLGQFGRRILAEATPLNLVPCAASNLAVRTTPDAGAGQRFASVYLENTGAAACALAAMPQVQLLDASARSLNVVVRAEREAPVAILALWPEQSAGFALRWSNWCGADPGEVGIRLALPNNGGQLTTGGIGTPPCLAPGQPSSLDVTPFHPDMVVALD